MKYRRFDNIDIINFDVMTSTLYISTFCISTKQSCVHLNLSNMDVYGIPTYNYTFGFQFFRMFVSLPTFILCSLFKVRHVICALIITECNTIQGKYRRLDVSISKCKPRFGLSGVFSTSTPIICILSLLTPNIHLLTLSVFILQYA